MTSAGGRAGSAYRPTTSTSVRASSGLRVSRASFMSRVPPLMSRWRLALGVTREGLLQAHRAVDHAADAHGSVIAVEFGDGEPARLGRVAARLQRASHHGRHIVDDDPVVADGPAR